MAEITIEKNINGLRQAITEILTDSESQCLLSQLQLRKRNRRIRNSYPSLKDQYGMRKAWQKLSEEEHISETHLKKILYS